jgi:hypothetical protein
MPRTFKPGDRVTLTAEVHSGLDSDGEYFIHLVGSNRSTYARHEALTLIAPAEPPVGSVVVKDGVAWTRGCFDWADYNDDRAAWSDLSDGEIIFTSGGDV